MLEVLKKQNVEDKFKTNLQELKTPPSHLLVHD